MNIQYIDIDKLKPYENNPRKNDQAVGKVAKSIENFGFKVPIVIDPNHTIVAGHTRYKASKKLGLDEIPCIIADDLTEEQIKAFRIADNRVGAEAEFDFELLPIELEGIGEFDIEDLGFDPGELDDLFKDEKEVVEDDYSEEPPEDPMSQRGDIWLLGEHRVMCGDSTTEDVDRLMDGEKADLVFTDPPYGMSLNADFSGMTSSLGFNNSEKKMRGNKYENVKGDSEDFKPELIQTVFDNFGYCKEIFLWGADYYAELLQDKNQGSWVVWDKRLDESADKMYGSTFELCWSKAKHKRMIARVKWAGLFGTEQEFDKKRIHPTQKPVKLVSWFFDYYSLRDKEKVVDLYGGSGSTLLACEQHEKTAYIMELDESYVDLMVDRYINFMESDEGVYLLRDGEKVPYKEVLKRG